MRGIQSAAKVVSAVVFLGAIVAGCSQGPGPEGEAAEVISEPATRCPTGDALCGGNCVNLQTSPRHCGACGNRCASGRSCVAGACVSSCSGTAVSCAGACVNVSTDPNNCGACGSVCPAPAGGIATCVAGVCTSVCSAGLARCVNACVNELADANNCGGCGHVCAAGQACTAGVCR